MQQPSPDVPLALASDQAVCRRLIYSGSKSFFAASLVLPSPVCQSAYALYAFCRVADDAVDLRGGKLEAVDRLRMRLDRAYAAQPLPDPVDRAFAEVVHRHALPRALPEALIEGLEWDARGRRYEDLSGVFAYSARVAGAVGAMMSVLMGVRSPAALARACDLGVAMQLTNIARDVAEDAREGRLYLPLGWLEEQGIDPDTWLETPVFDDRIRLVVRRLLARADDLYSRAGHGVGLLPIACRPGIHAARRIYAEIGRVLEDRDYDPSRGRAFVQARRKAFLLGHALVDALTPPAQRASAPALAEVNFLVEAVQAAPPAAVRPRAVWRGLDTILDTIQLLEEREREQLRLLGESRQQAAMLRTAPAAAAS